MLSEVTRGILLCAFSCDKAMLKIIMGYMSYFENTVPMGTPRSTVMLWFIIEYRMLQPNNQSCRVEHPMFPPLRFSWVDGTPIASGYLT